MTRTPSGKQARKLRQAMLRNIPATMIHQSGHVTVPRFLYEPLLSLFLTEVPLAEACVHMHQFPGEEQPWPILDRAGLEPFKRWLWDTEEPVPDPVGMVNMLYAVSLSQEAGYITDPDECLRLCQPPGSRRGRQ